MKAVQRPKRSAYRSAPSTSPGLAQDPHADAGARADHDREDHLTAHVPPERALDALGQRQAAVRRETAVDRPLEPRHVEEHVDRDHDDEDRRRRAGGSPRAPRPGRTRSRPARSPRRPRRRSTRSRSSSCCSIRIPSRPWSSSHAWKRSTSTSTPVWSVAGSSSVTYVSIRSAGGARLRDDDGAERDEQADEDRGEHDRDDRDREPAREAKSRQLADEGVERERDHGRGEEEEEDVAQRAGEQEREQEQHRQHDELDPARDPDRRLSRHRLDRNARPTARLTLRCRDEVGIPVRYRASMASPRSRQAARLRERRRRAQRRARLLVLLSVVGALGRRHAAPDRVRLERLAHRRRADLDRLARGRDRRSPTASRPRDDREPPRAASRRGGLAHRDRVPRQRTTARSRSSPSGGRRTPGLLARLWHRIAGSGNDSTHWYQLEGTTAGTNQLDVGTPPGTDVYAPVQGSVVGGQRPRRRGAERRQPDRHPAVPRAVRDGLRAPRQARSRAHRRLAGAGRRVEARHGRRPRGGRAAGARHARSARREQRLDRRVPRRSARCPRAAPR